MTKHCISCGEDGHTYLECSDFPFGQLVAGAFGVPDLIGGKPERPWTPVGSGTPVNAWLETKRFGEKGTNECFCRIMSLGDDPEWIDRDGRTTVTHHSFAAPTHWRWPTPAILGSQNT